MKYALEASHQDGIEKGIGIGVEQTAINMIKLEVDENIIALSTQLSLEQIKEIKSKL